ncbi:type II secretion system protein GspD [Alienimonas sp. DA493]|uniref:type II secretion system protein GspD n=1 Tax=Alienimonas sp. DA493 TaxID=3373605 RepID=UPI00375477C0
MSRTTAPRRSATVAAGRICAAFRLSAALAAALAAVSPSAIAPRAFAQTDLSTAPGLTEATREKLNRRVTLTLPGVPLREALMSVREVAGLNLVVNQELTGTVDMAFRDAPVHEVLDTLLLSRGLGYRPVGDGLVVVPIADLGAQNPLLATEVFATPSVEPTQLLPIVEEMLSPEGRVHAMPAGRALVAFDYPSRLDAIRAQVARLDAAAADRSSVAGPTTGGALLTRPPGAGGPAPGGPAMDSTVVELLYVPATAMASTLVPLLGENGRVSAMDNEGRLLIVDTPANLAAIQAAVRKLDVPRVQVRIRALIYDCAIEDSRDLGLNWNGGLRGRGFAADGSPLQELTFSGVTAAGAVSPTAAGGLAAFDTASRYLDLTTTLRALNESADSRLLADPNVVVLNHEKADIKIVTEVPYQELTQSALGGAIGTTSFREAGVRLEVTPHIAADRTITMQVHPEFSVLSGFTPDSNAPIIDTREATTTVRVGDRETLVLGGLRQRSKVKTVSSLPFFGSMPVCGRLFRKQDFEVRESELLVFLSPEIIGPCHSGDCRETGIAVFAASELEASPLSPTPMGASAALQEDRGAWGKRHFHRAERRGRWEAPAGAVGNSCELPAEVYESSVVTGLIAPEHRAPHLDAPAIPPAPAPPTSRSFQPDPTGFEPPPPPFESAPPAGFAPAPRAGGPALVPPASPRRSEPTEDSDAAASPPFGGGGLPQPFAAPPPLPVPPAFPDADDAR